MNKNEAGKVCVYKLEGIFYQDEEKVVEIKMRENGIGFGDLTSKIFPVRKSPVDVIVTRTSFCEESKVYREEIVLIDKSNKKSKTGIVLERIVDNEDVGKNNIEGLFDMRITDRLTYVVHAKLVK